jgi:hypothetical protein
MITRITEVVLLFYQFSIKRYSFYKIAGSKTKNTLKTYQTVLEHIHHLHHEKEHLTGNITNFSLAFLEHHKIRLRINLV